jgi:hypothetical protein
MEILKGIIRDYDGTNHKADVQLFGSMATLVRGVPVSHQVGGELLGVGRLCAVLFSSGDDGVVIATWDGATPEWVTSDLIVDGEVGYADLAASAKGLVVCDEASSSASTTSSSYVDMTGSSLTVSIRSGVTAYVFLVAVMTISCDSAGEWTRARVRCVDDAVYGQARRAMSPHANDMCSLVCDWLRSSQPGEKEYRIEWQTQVSGHTSNVHGTPILYAIVVPA